MKTAEELYRQLNNANKIPELQQDCICFSPDQMIWFGDQVIKYNGGNKRELFNKFYDWLDGLTQEEFDIMSLTEKCEKFFFNK